ncbi:MAG: ATP-binding protein [Roseovarius sp.]
MAKNLLRFWREDSDPFEALFDLAPIAMHSIDRDGKLLNASHFWAEKLGYTRDEMIGRKSTEFLTPASQQDAIDKVLPGFFKHGVTDAVEYDFVKKSGEVVPVILSAIAQYDSQGNFARSLAIMFDNSENKRLWSELTHNLRMRALGQLVAGVAHDFNNILTVIKGNIEFLIEDPNDPNRDDLMRDTWRSAERGAALTQMLLSYGQRSHLRPKEANLNNVIREMDHMIRRVLPSKLDISVVTAGGLWGVNLDTHQLETALMNILNNARDAMPLGGQITIETCNVRISEEFIAARDEDILPGRYVMLAISDTGDGISPEMVDRVFEPYFTTKPFGQGSGLGLSMVFGYVKQSGGTIRVYSEEGFGTTFKLYFPAVSFGSTASEANQDTKPRVVPTPLADVLIVEDENDVRRVLAKQIAKGGYSVSQAKNGDEAFTLLNTGYRPKVMVTDIIMPGALQGPELAERARDLIDGLEVIFVSGLPQEAAINSSSMLENDVLIQKPIDSGALLREIETALGAQPPEDDA